MCDVVIMSRKSSEIIEDIEDIRQSMLNALSSKDALLFIDLQFLLNQVTDLKQELRLSLIDERQD